MLRAISYVVFALTATQVAGQELTLGALVSSGQKVTQMTTAEINADKVHLLLLLEGDKGGFLCKVEALVERDNITPLVKPETFPDILGLKTSDAVKWRTCAQIY